MMNHDPLSKKVYRGKKNSSMLLLVLQHDISEQKQFGVTTDRGMEAAVRFKTAPQALPCWPDTPL